MFFVHYGTDEISEIKASVLHKKIPNLKVTKQKDQEVDKFDPKQLVKYGKLEKYEADKFIFQEGEDGDTMYMILKGVVAISYEGVLLASLEGGDIIGEMSLLDNQPRSASAKALTETLTLAVTKENFLPLIRNSDEFTIRLLSSLSSRIRVQNHLISELTQQSC